MSSNQYDEAYWNAYFDFLDEYWALFGPVPDTAVEKYTKFINIKL